MLYNSSQILIYGGQRHVHYVDESCYDDSIYVFNIPCNSWTVHRMDNG